MQGCRGKPGVTERPSGAIFLFYTQGKGDPEKLHMSLWSHSN